MEYVLFLLVGVRVTKVSETEASLPIEFLRVFAYSLDVHLKTI